MNYDHQLKEACRNWQRVQNPQKPGMQWNWGMLLAFLVTGIFWGVIAAIIWRCF